MRSKNRTRTLIAAVALAAVASVPVVNAVTSGTAQAADALPGDGTTSTTAGASCWGIKQQYPTSASGVYWVANAAMDRPAQVYCDQATSGGGWVLVARGRNGWTFDPAGQGSPTTVRTTPDGTGAFAPAALDGPTINTLLANAPVSSLPDGIRLERATNTTGTARQDVRLFPRFAKWNWSFDAGQLLNKVVIDGQTYNGSNTYDTSASVAGQTTNALSGQQGTRRLFTFAWANHNNVKGFGLGSGVNGGSSAASNYLWTAANEGYPLAFTRVWVRPQIANSAAGFTALPANGFPAQPKPAQFKNRSELAPWGVVGLDHTNETNIEPYRTNVLSMRANGDRVFIGGRFTGVQQGPTGTEVPQGFLAAFDLDGNWISSFRPQVNGRVWDMVVADGKLIIAGDFTTVNGTPTQGMAALDPATGQSITTWKANAYRADGTRSWVRGLDVANGQVYAVGNFNRIQGGSNAPASVTRAISVSVADGKPGAWHPQLSGSGVRVDVTDDNQRVLIAGSFNNINGDANHGYFGVVDATTGAVVPGLGAWTGSIGSGTKLYQQAVQDLGDGRMLVGGSEHDFQLWNNSRTQLIDSTITKQGGDTQVIERVGNRIAMGCHCGDWLYQGTNNWSSPTGFRSVDPINLVGLWDPATFEYDTTWYPSGLKGTYGEGIWTVDTDSRGCMWVGGDLKRGAYSGNAATDFLGGFARFCANDTTPPTTPTNFKASVDGSSINLSWGASTDDVNTPSYDVYRDDRVIGSTWGTTWSDVNVTGNHRYTVRAADARGNRSASPAPVSVNGPAPVIGVAKAFATSWKYNDTGADLGTAWKDAGFDDAAWPAGNGTLGWGRTGLGTTIGASKPKTAYFRSTFPVANPANVRVLDLGVKQATGSVVYVNGIEVGRINMPTGPITAASPAAGYISGTAETQTNRITVPAGLLKTGTNTVAVELHSMTAGSSRAFFDLEATLYAATADSVAPTAPNLTGSSVPNKVTLSWTGATDDVALGGFIVTRDGQTLAVTGPTATGWIDAVDTTTPHAYKVTAFDTNGNTKVSNEVSVGQAADPNILPFKATWRWSFPAAGAPTGWNAEAFDDSTWASGAGEFGFGEGDEGTVISTAPTPRPVTAYYRTVVQVPNPAAFTSILANVLRDDSVAVYVNGVEVGRDNLPAGPLLPTTLALTGKTKRADELVTYDISIPSSAFKPGANTIAVELHANDRYTGDHSFDLKLTGTP